MATEGLGTTTKTDMAEGMIDHGVSGMITLGMIIGLMTEVPTVPKTKTEFKASEYS